MRIQTVKLGTFARNIGLPVDHVMYGMEQALERYCPSSPRIKEYFGFIDRHTKPEQAAGHFTALHRAYTEFRKDFCEASRIDPPYSKIGEGYVSPLLVSILYGENHLNLIDARRDAIAHDNPDINLEGKTLAEGMRMHEALAIKELGAMAKDDDGLKNYFHLMLALARLYVLNGVRNGIYSGEVGGDMPTRPKVIVEDYVLSAAEVASVSGATGDEPDFKFLHDLGVDKGVAGNMANRLRMERKEGLRHKRGHGLSREREPSQRSIGVSGDEVPSVE